MNQLTLDVSDPDVAAMVSEWANGGKYTVELAITQVSSDGKVFTATVDEVLDYGEGGEPVAVTKPAPKPPPKKAAAKVPYPAEE